MPIPSYFPNYFPTLDHLFITKESKQDFMQGCVDRYEQECKVYEFLSQDLKRQMLIENCIEELNRPLTDEEKMRIWEEILEKKPENYQYVAKKIGLEGLNFSEKQGVPQRDCIAHTRREIESEHRSNSVWSFSPGNSSSRYRWMNFFPNQNSQFQENSRAIKLIFAGSAVFALLGSYLLFRRLSSGSKISVLKGEEVALSRTVVQTPEITKLAAVFLFSIGLSSYFYFANPSSKFVS